MKSRWLTHLNCRILYIDLSGLRDDVHAFDAEISATVSTLGQEMYQQPPNSVLVLVDIRNTALTRDANRILTERIKDTKKYVKRTAVVGMTGIRKAFLDFFSLIAESETGSFEEPEAAKAWLVH